MTISAAAGAVNMDYLIQPSMLWRFLSPIAQTKTLRAGMVKYLTCGHRGGGVCLRYLGLQGLSSEPLVL